MQNLDSRVAVNLEIGSFEPDDSRICCGIDVMRSNQGWGLLHEKDVSGV
jgi:hypothetical protein